MNRTEASRIRIGTATGIGVRIRIGATQLGVNRNGLDDGDPRMDDDVGDVDQVAGFFSQIFGQKVQ